MQNEVIVVGGGIVGMATALALAERGAKVAVLEAEAELAAHQTGHNSGVIHSGLYYRPGSLKATLCREGCDRMYRFCVEHGIPHRRTGKLVTATTEAQLPRLDTLEERGRQNGLSVQRLTAAGIREREPAASGIAGLWVEETGIVDYRAVTQAMARALTARGGRVETGQRVIGIDRVGSRIAVRTTRGAFQADQLVNCAGLQTDRVARLAGVETSVRIVAFRGEYYAIRPERAHLVRGLIYPVPDPALPFLGVHLTRGIDGLVEAGPNAVLAFRREGYRWRDVSIGDLAEWAAFPGFWRMARKQWRNGFAEMRRSLSPRRFVDSLRELVPELGLEDVVRHGSGVRAQAVDREGRLVDDFVLERLPDMVHVLNAPSPAATASLAIGGFVADHLLGKTTAESAGR